MTFVTTLLSLAALASSPAPAADLQVTWTAPKSFLDGSSYVAHVEVTAPADGGTLPAFAITGSAFTVDGKPLGKREDAKLELAPGQKIVTDIDLAPLLAHASVSGSFKLGFANSIATTPEIEVSKMQAAAKGLDFMKMEPAELAKYHVILQTNKGDMEVEFWPDAAPNHVRNFLDLCYTGFYNGLTFHRVIPGFMIQGGDPTGTGTGNGPRTLKAEFSRDPKYKHVAGVLSMARSQNPDSASCQFFVMHGTSPHLDGQYSAFGKLVSGLEVVDKIVNAKKGGNDKPIEPQTIVKATVIQVGK